MTHKEANNGNVNPKFDTEKQYQLNCQTCTVTYVARKMGIDVEAIGNNNDSVVKYLDKNNVNWTGRFVNSDGSKVRYNYYSTWANANKKTFSTKNLSEFF